MRLVVVSRVLSIVCVLLVLCSEVVRLLNSSVGRLS